MISELVWLIHGDTDDRLSDHNPNILRINLWKEHFFKLWRLNVSLLRNIKVVEELKQNLKEYFEIKSWRGNIISCVGGVENVMRGK